MRRAKEAMIDRPTFWRWTWRALSIVTAVGAYIATDSFAWTLASILIVNFAVFVGGAYTITKLGATTWASGWVGARDE